MGAIGIKQKQLNDYYKANEMEMAKKHAEFEAMFKQTSDEINRGAENLKKTRENTFSNISKRHSELNDIISKANKSSDGHTKIMAEQDKISKELDDLLASFSESVNTESISGAITVALTVTSILSALGVIIDLILRAKDNRDIQENIKYIRIIKRKLTTDLPKIKNKKIADKYKVFIEKISRAEDEFTGRLTITK